MPYTASIDRRNPGCFLFLVDQSSSMSQPLGGQVGQLKMNAAADAMNRVLNALVQRCSRGMEVRDYFHVGILGYGHAIEAPYDPGKSYFYMDENEVVQSPPATGEIPQSAKMFEERIVSVFPGTDPQCPFLPIGQVADAARVVDRDVWEVGASGEAVEVSRKVPVWLHPHAGAQTPMRQALLFAEEAVTLWIAQHPDSYPPIVINVSDGNATDGDPEPVARRIMGLATADGNSLLFNCHLSDRSSIPTQYPDSGDNLHDDFARQMFRMSSILPAGCIQHAARLGITVSRESRCCVFNADMVSLVHFLDIGTRGPNILR